jgi:hypothetical protein
VLDKERCKEVLAVMIFTVVLAVVVIFGSLIFYS